MTSVLKFACGILYIIQGVYPLTLESYTACYGNTGLDNFLRPKCADGNKMAAVGLSAFGKTLATTCPISITHTNKGNVSESCCQYDPDDCAIRYDTAVYRSYYQNCNGKNNCTIQVSWVPTPCNHSVYLDRTNYMKLDYYCIANQGLDPCSSINTKDNQVFLWNSGYPTASLTGSSSCTCSVEASCNTSIQITAIDMRLGSTSSCGQSISINDGGILKTFDCSKNNDYLPTLLYTSLSYFIRINISDNHGSAAGYYFLLLEGSTKGSELTLSCSSTSMTSPSTPKADLTSCPGDSTTTASTVLLTSKKIDTSETTNTASVTEQTLTSDGETLTITEKKGSTPTITANTGSPRTGNTITKSTDILPTFVSITPTSTEKDVTATSLSTEDFQTSDETAVNVTGISMEITSTIVTESTDSSSHGTVGKTTEKADSETSNNSILIGAVVVVFVLLALIVALIWYKDKINECCCKSKVDSATKGDQEDSLPIYYTIFDENLNIENRTKPHHLPPLQHHVFNRGSTKLANKRKKNKIQNKDPNDGKVTDTGQPTQKVNKQKKKKQSKGKQKEKEVTGPLPKLKPSHDKSTFPVISILVDSNAGMRRQSVIDISDADGHLETSIAVRDNSSLGYLQLRRS